MAKALSYKLALISGLSSTLLATAAFANTTGGLSITMIDEEGEKIESSHLPDRACGAKQSYARYLLVNESNHKIKLTDVDLNINQGDDFPFNRFIVRKDRFLPLFGTTCEAGTELHRNGGSCELVVDMTPIATLCLNTTDRGTIDRELEIQYTNSHHDEVSQAASLVEPINFEINLLGGIGEYAVMSDRVYIREDVTDPLNVVYSHLQVEQDVTSAEGLLGFYAYPQNIWFNDGFFDIFLHSYPAFYDARHLADRLEDLVGDVDTCNQLTITGIPDADPTDPTAQVVTPGFWCLNNPSADVSAAASQELDGYFIMDGDEDQLFVIALNQPAQDYDFGNNDAITVELRNGANPDNIIWLITDEDSTLNVNLTDNSPANEPQSNNIFGTVLPGTILSRGTVNINDAEVLGRVIGVSERTLPFCVFGCNSTTTTLNFYGNVAIENPAHSVVAEEVDVVIAQ